jgi:uncharacterized membrane protein YgdD (TMEM256/DUF423 family)
MNKIAYTSGALLGLSGVIAGALGAHALEQVLDPDQLSSYETAVRFQMYHSLLLLLLGLLSSYYGKSKGLQVATLGVLIGTLLFSGSIYLLVLSSLPVGLITPIGGLVLIVGWAGLAVWAFRLQREVKVPKW